MANYGTDRISGFNVNPTTGALTPSSGSPDGTGASPPDANAPLNAVLGVGMDPDGGHLFSYNHNANPPSVGTWAIAANGSLSEVAGSPNTDPAGNQDPFAGAVSPDGDDLYVPMENITAPAGPQDQTSHFSVAANGALSFISEVNTGGPAIADGNPFGSGIPPDGRCYYVSAPEDLTPVGRIYGFSVIATGSLVTAPGSPYAVGGAIGGNHPLNMAASPDSEHSTSRPRAREQRQRLQRRRQRLADSPIPGAVRDRRRPRQGARADARRQPPLRRNQGSDNISRLQRQPTTAP